MFYAQIRIIAGIQLLRGFRVLFMRIDDTIMRSKPIYRKQEIIQRF